METRENAAPRPTGCPRSPRTRKVRQVLVVRSGRHGGRRVAVIRAEPAKPSFGQMIGLHQSADSLELKSGVALVLDQDTNEVLFSKNSEAVLPIASLTKLMTAVVVTEAQQPLDELDHDHRRGHRHREGQPLAPARRHPAAPRGHAAPGADVVGEPRRQRARPQLSGRPRRVRRGDEPQGARPRHERHPLRRADGAVEPQPVERARPGDAGQGGARSAADPRALDLARVHGRGRQSQRPVPQHQRPRQEPGVGDRPAEDRLHLRSRALPGDAGEDGRAPADHGVPRFGRQVLADRRRRARAPLDHGVGAERVVPAALEAHKPPL